MSESQALAIVTGPTSGIGREIARGLLQHGYHVVLAARSRERAQQLQTELAADGAGERSEVLHLDLASLMTVRNFANRFAARHQRLDVLVNNAAVWAVERRLGVDGIELSWVTNVLGPLLLTELLQPQLAAAAPSRVVNVASTFARGLDLEDVEFERRRYDGVAAYAQSKQANRMLSWELARRWRAEGIAVHAVHPGLVDSELFRELGGLRGRLTRWAVSVFGRAPHQGADTAVWAATSHDLDGETGLFLSRRRRRRCRFRDPQREHELHELCLEMCRPRPAGGSEGSGQSAQAG